MYVFFFISLVKRNLFVIWIFFIDIEGLLQWGFESKRCLIYNVLLYYLPEKLAKRHIACASTSHHLRLPWSTSCNYYVSLVYGWLATLCVSVCVFDRSEECQVPVPRWIVWGSLCLNTRRAAVNRVNWGRPSASQHVPRQPRWLIACWCCTNCPAISSKVCRRRSPTHTLTQPFHLPITVPTHIWAISHTRLIKHMCRESRAANNEQ